MEHAASERTLMDELDSVEFGEDSAVLHIHEHTPIGDPDRNIHIVVPKEAAKMDFGDTRLGYLEIKESYQMDLKGIPTMRLVFDVKRNQGYGGEISELYLMSIPGMQEIFGLFHGSIYIERKGYENWYEGPIRLGERDRQILVDARIDLRDLGDKATMGMNPK